MGNATFEVIQDSRNLTLVRTRRVAQQRLIIPDLHTESHMKPRWAARTLSQWKGMKGRGPRRQRGYTKRALCSFPITHAGFFFSFAPVVSTQTQNYLKAACKRRAGRQGVAG